VDLQSHLICSGQHLEWLFSGYSSKHALRSFVLPFAFGFRVRSGFAVDFRLLQLIVAHRSCFWITGSKARVFLILILFRSWFLYHAHNLFDEIFVKQFVEVLLVTFCVLSFIFRCDFCFYHVFEDQ
jgi:hypothetical protein